MDALETLANTCTNVLENTLLHRQLSQRLEELERVNRLLRENQSYLLQAERLADMGRLAATVAHEFKTPLVTIGGHARRVLRDINTNKFRKKDLEIIIDEVIRLEKISSEILEYSRPSKFDITRRRINDLVRESLELLEQRLSSANITLKLRLHDENPFVAVDEKKFKQVVFNTVDNAIDAMKPGMLLRVETQPLNGNAVIHIIDTGSGIDGDIHDKIFNPFFTTKSRGSGLGLSVSKKIVEDHGGFIEFESKSGEGTAFSIHFPIVYR